MLRDIFKGRTDPTIDYQINAIVQKMDEVGVEDPMYPKLMSYLLRLQDVKTNNRRKPVSLDTIAIVGGNILLGVIIVLYENKHVWTSKAVPQFLRPKGQT